MPRLSKAAQGWPAQSALKELKINPSSGMYHIAPVVDCRKDYSYPSYQIRLVRLRELINPGCVAIIKAGATTAQTFRVDSTSLQLKASSPDYFSTFSWKLLSFYSQHAEDIPRPLLSSWCLFLASQMSSESTYKFDSSNNPLSDEPCHRDKCRSNNSGTWRNYGSPICGFGCIWCGSGGWSFDKVG